jgi:hypothetical protein
MPPKLSPLVQEKVPGISSDYLIGWMDKSDVKILRHCSMYLVSELDTIDEVDYYSNPVAIVAKNEIIALGIFTDIAHKYNGTIMSPILDRCDGIKVEPTGVAVKSRLKRE